MKELNEMTIGRTDDPGNPLGAKACEAAFMFGTGSRTPSGPAVMAPRQQAGHMIAIDPPVRFLIFSLAPKGPSTHAPKRMFGGQAVPVQLKRNHLLRHCREQDVPDVAGQWVIRPGFPTGVTGRFVENCTLTPATDPACLSDRF